MRAASSFVNWSSTERSMPVATKKLMDDLVCSGIRAQRAWVCRETRKPSGVMRRRRDSFGSAGNSHYHGSAITDTLAHVPRSGDDLRRCLWTEQ